MAREFEGYRDCLELLNVRFPDKDMLNIAEVMQFCGISRNTAKKQIKFNSFGKITKSDLARQVITG